MHADCIGQSLFAFGELSANAFLATKCQIGMGIGVVADGVFGNGDAARNLRLGGGVLADEKECRFHIVLREHVEKIQGMWIVRAVVEGERQLLGVGEAVQRLAEQFRLGRDGAVAGDTCRSQSCCSRDPSEHAAILIQSCFGEGRDDVSTALFSALRCVAVTMRKARPWWKPLRLRTSAATMRGDSPS